jgi:hypothetical protein
MDPKLIILASLGSFLILSKGSSSSSSPKFVPDKQPSFKKNLNLILVALEEKLDCPYLRDYFMCVAYVESRFLPSAIRYESGGYYPSNTNTFREPYLWKYTGGLFQMFPFVALDTADGTAKDLDPRYVFNPLYAIAFAIDFAYRLNKYHEADRWLYVRFGWRSLKTLNEKPLEIGQQVQDRMIKAADELGIDPNFLYQHPDFTKYKNLQFKGTLNWILNNYAKET